jgi:hypothetical protein
MEKRRTFLLLVLLAVISAWAFTIFSQRALEEGARSRRSQAAKARHFSQGQDGRWEVVEPDETVSQVLQFSAKQESWLAKAGEETQAQDPAASDSGLSAQPGPAADLLEIRMGGSKAKLVDTSLAVQLFFVAPEGLELKHGLWLSPDRKRALAEMGDANGAISLFLWDGGTWKPLQAADESGPAGAILVGSEHFSPQWAYLGFGARGQGSDPDAWVCRSSDLKWHKEAGLSLLSIEDDGSLHLGNLGSQVDSRFP